MPQENRRECRLRTFCLRTCDSTPKTSNVTPSPTQPVQKRGRANKFAYAHTPLGRISLSKGRQSYEGRNYRFCCSLLPLAIQPVARRPSGRAATTWETTKGRFICGRLTREARSRMTMRRRWSPSGPLVGGRASAHAAAIMDRRICNRVTNRLITIQRRRRCRLVHL